jgi:dephospho-CoA kinase
MTFIVGLTGGIGCGKTTVSQLFAELGVSIIDTDEIAHVLTAAHGPAIPAIADVFGTDYIDEHGALNRTLMRELVFNDAAAKDKLEAILHPMIYQSVIEAIARHTDAAYILLAVPLLIETGRYLHLVQRILVVDCDEQQQISRTMARSNLSANAVQRIMANQASRQQRLQQADDIILNQGAPELTQQQVMQLHQSYLLQAHNLSTTH